MTNANTNRVSFADLPPEVREFIGNTASDFFMDNYPDGDDFDEDEEPPLENEQLRAIAEMTNERFGTDYNDDDIFDFFNVMVSFVGKNQLYFIFLLYKWPICVNCRLNIEPI